MTRIRPIDTRYRSYMTVQQKPKAEPYQYNCNRRLPPEIYEDNYCYLINYYQPMIDYLDAKERGDDPKPPTLPWLCEMWMDKYNTRKPIKKYDEDDLPELADKARERAEHFLPDYRSNMKRSHFSITQTAHASRVAEHLKRVSFIEDMEKKLKKRNQELEKTLKREREQRVMFLENRLKREYMQADIEWSPYLQTAMRGKNEDRIANILLWDSKKRRINIDLKEDARYIYQKRQLEAWKQARKFELDELDKHGESKWLQRDLSWRIRSIRKELNSFYARTKELKDIEY